jgi:hypothetical protein
VISANSSTKTASAVTFTWSVEVTARAASQSAVAK